MTDDSAMMRLSLSEADHGKRETPMRLVRESRRDYSWCNGDAVPRNRRKSR